MLRTGQGLSRGKEKEEIYHYVGLLLFHNIARAIKFCVDLNWWGVIGRERTSQRVMNKEL